MLQSIASQIRVIVLLVRLEARSRFGSNIGAMISEFLDAGFLLLLMIGLRLLAGATAHRGMQIAPFVASGLIVLITFRSSIQQTLGTPAAFERLQSALPITILDLDIARTIVDFLIHVALAVFLFTGLVAFDQSFPPENPLGIVWTIGLGAIFGLFFGQAVRNFIPDGFFRKLVVLGTGRAALWFSGAFFVAPELPYAWRDIMLLNPLLQLTELVRTDYFVVYTSDHFDADYVATCLAALCLIGLVAERAVRNRERTA